MTTASPERPFLIQGLENGSPVEFTAATIETAERLVAQLREQGVADLRITNLQES